MKILYFSWLKEKVGKTSEEIEKPNEVHSIKDLIEFYQVTFINIQTMVRYFIVALSMK